MSEQRELKRAYKRAMRRLDVLIQRYLRDAERERPSGTLSLVQLPVPPPQPLVEAQVRLRRIRDRTRSSFGIEILSKLDERLTQLLDTYTGKLMTPEEERGITPREAQVIEAVKELEEIIITRGGWI